MQISISPSSQQVFGVTVDGLRPGEAVRSAARGEHFESRFKADGYPHRSLEDMPAGDYTVQAVLNVYQTFHRSDGKTVKLPPDMGEGQHWNIKPGNLYSKPVKVHVAAGIAAGCASGADGGDSADQAGCRTRSTFGICGFESKLLSEVLGDADLSERGGDGAAGVR